MEPGLRSTKIAQGGTLNLVKGQRFHGAQIVADGIVNIPTLTVYSGSVLAANEVYKDIVHTPLVGRSVASNPVAPLGMETQTLIVTLAISAGSCEAYIYTD